MATIEGVWKPFQVIYIHRHLLLLLLKRDMISRTSGTVLGTAWLFVQPGLQILGFWFLLDVVLSIKLPGRVAFVDYFLLGMLPWLLISDVLLRSLGVLEEFGGLYRRSVFPIVILPMLPIVLSVLLYMVVMSVIVGLMEGIHAIPIALLVILVLGIWLIPICYLFSVLGLFIKDIGQFFPFLITVAMYLTPILYMPIQMPESMHWALVINPIADIMALIHAGIQGMEWDWGNVWRPMGLWLLLLGPSWVLFRRAEPQVREIL